MSLLSEVLLKLLFSLETKWNSLRSEVWARRTSLTPPLFIKCKFQDRKVSGKCLRYWFNLFVLQCSTAWWGCFFSFYIIYLFSWYHSWSRISRLVSCQETIMDSYTDMLINYFMLVKTDLRLKWHSSWAHTHTHAIPSKRRGHARVIHMRAKRLSLCTRRAALLKEPWGTSTCTVKQ